MPELVRLDFWKWEVILIECITYLIFREMSSPPPGNFLW